MRILFTKQQPLTAPGGETSHLFALANNMRDMGNDVYLMPVTDTPTPSEIWPRELVRDIPPFGLHPLFDSFPISRAAARFAKQNSVDAIISWQYETSYLPDFTRQKNFIHAVIAAAPFGFLKRKSDSNLARRIAYHSFHFRLLRKADVIYCASNFARDDIINSLGIPPQKIVVIPIGVDEMFQPSFETKAGPLHNFIFAGSLEPIKGIFDAIAALGLILQRGYTEWSLQIVGWGDENAVRAAARQAGVENHIHFLGALNRSTLAAKLAHADLAILPSHVETFGLSIAEALACELPIVSYRTSAIPEVIQDGITGILVSPFDHGQLTDAIIRLINNPENAKKMGKEGRKHIREHYKWEKTTKELLSSIGQLRAMKS